MAAAPAYWTLTDNLGSVRDVIDNSATVKDSLQYDSFGNIDTSTELDSAYRGRYAYTGREFDVETQLQYNRARYYDATTGRWISQDPMGFDAGDSNLYRYSRNQPVAHSDPSGQIEWSVDFGAKTVTLTVKLSFIYRNSADVRNDELPNNDWINPYFKTYKDAPDTWTMNREKTFEKSAITAIQDIWNQVGINPKITIGTPIRGRTVQFTPVLKVVIDNTRPDFKINVYSNSRGIPFPAQTDGSLVNVRAYHSPSSGGTGNVDAWIAENDFSPAANNQPNKGQIVIAHEFGHLLGVPHPGTLNSWFGAPAPLNVTADYSADAKSLMGRGNEMHPRFYERWLVAVQNAIANKYGWD